MTSNQENNHKELLKHFRQNVSDILKPAHDEAYLLRWLRARDFDLAESEKMLRDHMKWRAAVKADEILTNWTPPPVLLAHYPGGQFGYDKAGRPIWIEPAGKADIKGLLASVKKSDMMKYKIWQAELMQKILQEQFVKLGRYVGLTLIFDMEDFSMKHLWKPALDFYSEMFVMFESNYPETLDCSLVINAPGLFPLAYSLVKKFLSPATKRKINILGSNWKSELLKVVDADQLPVHWGGNATDPDGDPCCKSKIVMGGTVDPKFYFAEGIDHSMFTRATIGRRSALKLPFQVDSSRSLLRWQFFTEGSDIKFGISFRSQNHSESPEELLVPAARLNSHMVPEDGSLTCEKAGIYTVTFDNSYSWFHGKKLLYQVDVLPPPENIDELKHSDSFNMDPLS